MNDVYKRKVELLLRLLPYVTDEECFAIHGGTAINLFVNDLPRLSVDIDVTYIPLEDRETRMPGCTLCVTRPQTCLVWRWMQGLCPCRSCTAAR